MVPGVSAEFAPIEEAIATHFLPALLDLAPEEVSSRRDLLALPVKYGGLGVPDPTRTGEEHYKASRRATESLTAALHPGGPAFDVARYTKAATDAIKTGRAERAAASSDKMVALVARAGKYEARRITRSTETGAWLTVMPMTWNGTGLEAE